MWEGMHRRCALEYERARRNEIPAERLDQTRVCILRHVYHPLADFFPSLLSPISTSLSMILLHLIRSSNTSAWLANQTSDARRDAHRGKCAFVTMRSTALKRKYHEYRTRDMAALVHEGAERPRRAPGILDSANRLVCE